ncbi:MAG: hypothetical protein PVSMB5_29950 [Ktedonobacteraceae bacterium]
MRRESVPRDDQVLLTTRWLSAIIVPFLLAAFGILYLLPEHTGDLFAWNIKPRMTAMMLGEAYLAGSYFFGRAVLSTRWHWVAVGFLPVTTFATLMGISTILHWDRFNHSHIAFWTWAVLYFTTPFLVLAVWWRNRKTDPGSPDTSDLLVPVWVRRSIGIMGAGTVLIGLLFFLQPDFMIGLWPWKLTPLTARVMGALFVLAGAGAICIAFDARWSAVRIPLQSLMFALVLIVLAIVFSWGDFRQTNPFTWIFVAGMLFLLVASPLFYLWMETHRQRIS